MKKILFTAFAAVAMLAMVACKSNNAAEPVATDDTTGATVAQCDKPCDKTMCPADCCQCSPECKEAKCEGCTKCGTAECCGENAGKCCKKDSVGEGCAKACEAKCPKAEGKECEKKCDKAK